MMMTVLVMLPARGEPRASDPCSDRLPVCCACMHTPSSEKMASVCQNLIFAVLHGGWACVFGGRKRGRDRGA